MAATTVDTLLVRIEADLSGLRRDLKRVEQTTKTSSQRVGRSLDNIDSGFAKIGRTAKALAPIIAGALGVGAVRSFVRVGSQVENLRIRLKFLFGDVEEGAKAFEVMAQFASRVPFSLEEIQNASGSLASVAKNANQLNELLVITGNIAAAFPISFQEAAANLQRAFSAGANSADLFREKVVLAMAGFQAGATVSIEETIQKFSEAFGTGGRIDGATEELAKTFTGTMSMLGDAVFNFQRKVVDAGLLDAFRELAEFLKDNVAQTDRLARVIGSALASAVRGVTTALKFLLENITSIIIALGVFASIKTVAAITGVGLAFVSLATNVMKAGGALKALRTILLASPLTLLAVAAAVAAEKAGLLDDILKKIKDKFSELFPEVDSTNESSKQLTKTIENLSKELGATSGKETPFEKTLKSLKDEAVKAQAEIRGVGPTLIQALASADALDELRPVNVVIRGHPEGEKPRLTREQIDALKEHARATDNANKKLAVYKKTQEDAAAAVLKHTDPAIQLEATIEELNRQLELAPENADAFNAAISDLGNQLDRLDPMFAATEDAARRMGDSIADSLANAVVEGKLSMDTFRNIFKTFISDLIAEAIKTFIIRKIMASIFGGFGGGGSPNSNSMQFTSGPDSFAGGGRIPSRATGGPVLVGERGPELFIPHSAGVIRNNHDTMNMMGGGKPTVVNQTFNIETGVADTVRAEILTLMPRIQAETVRAVTDGKRRGTGIAKVFA